MDNSAISTQFYDKHHFSSSQLNNRGLLVCLSHNSLGKTKILDKYSIVIGRSDDCDFKINDQLISKEHCKITIDEHAKFFIEDLESKNSTFINGKKVKKKTHLIYGDKIIIGNTILRFYLEENLKN